MVISLCDFIFYFDVFQLWNFGNNRKLCFGYIDVQSLDYGCWWQCAYVTFNVRWHNRFYPIFLFIQDVSVCDLKLNQSESVWSKR